jgi:ubiquinone/menaquinone biosynthesis C-methylase UbiE
VPANKQTGVFMDPKQIVSRGYDQIAQKYSLWGTRREERAKYTSLILDLLPIGAKVLELGCGAGVPTTQELQKKNLVTGVDISEKSIEIAKINVPQANFIVGDMTKMDFPSGSFAGVGCFYSIIHVPRSEHFGLLCSIKKWLVPGGVLVATMGSISSESQISDDWLGAKMFWSNFDATANKKLVRDAGFEVVSEEEETADEDGTPITFLWVVARKPLETPLP